MIPGGYDAMAKYRIDSEVTGERLIGELVGRPSSVTSCSFGTRLAKDAAFARVRGIERPGIEFDALAEALDETEAVVVHGRFHHLQHMVGIRVRGAGHESGSGRDGLFHGVDRLIDGTPDVGLALEPEGEVGEVCFLVRP
jgi:hypothetical protein